MKKYITLLLLTVAILSGSAQTKLISATDLGITSANLINIFTQRAQYDVRSYKIVYRTTDIDGTSTIASGILSLPDNMVCTNLPLMSYNHGTVLQKENVVSRNNGEAFITKAMATLGFAVVSPDYLGLGDNPGLHPYLHAESQATATLDIIRAARDYITDSLGLALNGEVGFTGYSQGGHAAMATLKYIQDNNLQGEFNIIAGGPASGPYNLSGSQSAVLLSNQPYSNPGYVCYLLFGLNRVYGNLYTNYSDILKAPYDTLIPPYFDGTYPMDSVNAKLPSRLRDFMQDTVLDNFIADSLNRTHPLWRALIAQDNYDWTPNFPLRMYYCTQDEQVSFQNALDADSAMTANGATQVQSIGKGPLNHGACVEPSLFDFRDYMDTVATACSGIGLRESLVELLEFYPNPASELIHFDKLNPHYNLSVQIVDYRGAVVLQREMGQERDLSIEHLASGSYLMSLSTEEGNAVFKLQVQ